MIETVRCRYTLQRTTLKQRPALPHRAKKVFPEDSILSLSFIVVAVPQSQPIGRPQHSTNPFFAARYSLRFAILFPDRLGGGGRSGVLLNKGVCRFCGIAECPSFRPVCASRRTLQTGLWAFVLGSIFQLSVWPLLPPMAVRVRILY